MNKIRHLIIVLCSVLSGLVFSQTTVSTNHINNNGNGGVTFNVQNTNSYGIIITGLNCHLGTSTANNVQLLYRTTPIYDYAAPWGGGVIGAGQNGWISAGTAIVNSNTANGVVNALSGLSISIPAGATYELAFGATTLQYMTLTDGGGANVNTFSAGGVNLITGDGIGWGSGVYPATPANYPRGFIGGVTFSPDLASALNFDGTDDYVSVPHNASLNFGTGDFSVEAYFKSSVSQTNYAGIVCKQNSGGSGGFQLVLYNNKIAAEISDVSLFLGVGNGLIGTTSLNDGNYHHVAMVVTKSQNKIELYVDGNVEATVTNAGLSALNVNYATALLIGIERTFVDKVNGNIDEVRLWNVARTKCEINSYKNCEIPTTATGLVANYHFNQGIAASNNSTVTTLTDGSGNSNNGALTNFALTGSTSNWISPGGVTSGSTTPLPLNITASPSTTTICNSQSAVLTGGGAVTYTWSGGITNAVAFAPTSTASYTVTGTASTGCTGTAVATVSVNNCTPAAALNFDGANDYVYSGNIMPSTYTKEAWINVSNLSMNNNIISGGADGQHAFYPPAIYGNKLSAGHNGNWNQVQDPTPIVANTWYHVAVTYDAATTTMKLYKDGILVSSNSAVPPFTGGSAVRIGAYDNALNLFEGALDEVRIWSVVRTQCEINTYKNCEIASAATGLIANYHFNQGFAGVANTVNTLTDASGNSNTGTLNNFALTGATSNWIAPGGVVSGSVTPASLIPVVTANVTNPVICNGASTTLNGGGANTYTWSGSVTDGVAFSPVNTATYTVIGTNTVTGCTSTNTAAQAVTVNPLPVVTANVINPVICNGASTTLNGGGASTYTWTGGVTDGVSFSPVNTTTYTVVGTNATTGCTNTAVTAVTVNPLPVVTANATSTVICNGQFVTLTGGGASTYTWSGGVSNGVAFAPANTATYTVVGTNATTGCTNTAVKAVTVNALPLVTASANNSVICNGATTTLNGGGATTYTWTGGVSNGVAFAPSSTTSYTVTGTNGSTNCTNTAVQTISVNALPVVTAAISNSVICEGSFITLNGGGADTYTWTGGINDGIAFSPLTSGSYTVTGTNTLTGCSSTNTAVESVTVNMLPIVGAAITNSVICEGFSTILNGGGADTYTWTGGVTDGVAFTPTVTGSYTVTGTNTLTGCTSTNVAVESVTVNPNPVISAASGAICLNGSYTITPNGANTYTISGGSSIVSPSVTTSYSVTGTSVDGCTANTAVVTVSVQSSLTVSIAGSNSVCDGNAVSLTANGAATYSWNTGSTSNTIAPTPTVNTTYSVVGTSGSCSDSAVVNITVNANPTVTAVSNTSLICAGQSVSLTASGAATYTWNSSVTGSTIIDTPTTTTTYTITGEDVNGCMDTVMFTQNVSPCTGIYAANGISTSILVYPNPTTGMVTVEVESNATVIVLNTLGQIISAGNVPAGKNQIDIKEFANGIYFLKVTQNGTQQTVRLIKE